MNKIKQFESLDKANAEVLAELLIDPNTSNPVKISIINKLLDETEADNFFETIANELLSYGACPNCGHENHWLVPEEDLNMLGIVTHEKDPRVKRMTTAEDCPKFQQACSKKKVNT